MAGRDPVERPSEGVPERVDGAEPFAAETGLHLREGPFDGVEAFAAFRDRVERGLRRVMQGAGSGRRVALFTSGGVIGTSVRLALAAPDRMALEVNWRVRNCSLTEFVFTKDRFTLDSFNALPHLEDPALWTYR